MLSLGTYFAIAAAEVEEGVAGADDDIFYLGDENGVVAGVLGGMETTFQIGEGAVQHWSAMLGTIETRACLSFSIFVGADRQGVIFRDRHLILSEHVNPEALPGVQMGVCAGLMVNADEDEKRIERDGGKGISGHAVDLTFVVHRDDGDPGGEAAHRLSKFCLS